MPRRRKSVAASARVIYYWPSREAAFYMLYACAKKKGDLTPKQARALARLIKEEFK